MNIQEQINRKSLEDYNDTIILKNNNLQKKKNTGEDLNEYVN